MTKEEKANSAESPGEFVRKERSGRQRGQKREKLKPLTKIVIRNLPPTMTEEEFLKQIDPLPEHDFYYYVAADWSLGFDATCRAYLNVKKYEDVFLFRDRFDGYVFVDSKGAEYAAIVEFAPFQGLAKNKSRKVDPKVDSIELEPHYKSFLAKLEEDRELAAKGGELKLEFTLDRKKEEKITSTPLLQYLANKKEKRREESKRRTEEKRRQRDEELERHSRNLTKIMCGRKDAADKGKDKENVIDKSGGGGAGGGGGGGGGANKEQDRKNSRVKRRAERNQRRHEAYELRKRERERLEKEQGEKGAKPAENKVKSEDDKKQMEATKKRQENVNKSNAKDMRVEEEDDQNKEHSKGAATNRKRRDKERKKEQRKAEPLKRADSGEEAWLRNKRKDSLYDVSDETTPAVVQKTVANKDDNKDAELLNERQLQKKRTEPLKRKDSAEETWLGLEPDCLLPSFYDDSDETAAAVVQKTVENKDDTSAELLDERQLQRQRMAEERRIRNKDRPSIAIYQPKARLRHSEESDTNNARDMRSNPPSDCESVKLEEQQQQQRVKKVSRYSERRSERRSKDKRKDSVGEVNAADERPELRKTKSCEKQSDVAEQAESSTVADNAAKCID